MYARTVNRFSSTKVGSWLVKHVASKVDPVLFKATNGRLTMTGRPTLPMLAMTTVGRKSGQPRTVQLAFEPDGASFLVVASAMGAEKHPAWRYNLEASGMASVQLKGKVVACKAALLTDAEKDAVWDRIKQTIPQMATYEDRTDRNIGVFRLTPEA